MEQAPRRQHPYVQEVLEAERAWTRAHHELDLETIAAMLAPEYIQVAVDGRPIRRAEALASYRSGEHHWDAAASDELEIQLYGKTAVVLGRWRARGCNHDVHFDYTARFSCVYVRRAGTWQIVVDHSTPIDDRAW